MRLAFVVDWILFASLLQDCDMLCLPEPSDSRETYVPGCKLSHTHSPLHPAIHMGWACGAHVEDHPLLYPDGGPDVGPIQFHEGKESFVLVKLRHTVMSSS